MPDWLNTTLFLTGAVLMAVALLRALAFGPRIRPRNSRRLWFGLTAFIAVFLVGYVGAVVLALVGRHQILVGVTSAVFFGGAFFVLLTIYLTTHLNADLAEAARRQEGLINELEVRNSTLESISYAVSHDLKSPLVTIRGFMGLVRTDAEAGNTKAVLHDLARIEKAADRMQSVMAGLLDLGVAGRLVSQPVPFPLNDAIAEAADHAAESIATSRISLEVQPKLPVVRVDPIRVVTVFHNLIENSAKFVGDQPKPRVDIQARHDDNGMVVCTVTDNGLGIESSDPDQVFEIFTRLEPGVEGHGVGLALVRRIIEAHGGAIQVRSEGTGLGSSFRFTLPAA